MGWTWVPKRLLVSTSGFMGDKGKALADEMACPYFLCPSNIPFVGAKKSKYKFVQRLSPRVYQFRCKHCGCLVIESTDGPLIPYEMRAEELNPAFLGRKASYNNKRY